MNGTDNSQDWTKRKTVIAFCKSLSPAVVEDYPFHDDNWTVMRHWGNRKGFAFIYERQGRIQVNVKCSPEWREFWRDTYPSVTPGYHMNKEHWNTIVLDGTVPPEEIQNMLLESFRLTAPKRKEIPPQC